MKLKFLGSILVAATLCWGIPAGAADQSVDLTSGAASWIGTSIVFEGGDDVITFTGLAAGTYDFVFSMEGQFITSLTATLNGQAAQTTSIGNLVFAGLESTGDAPFVLTLTGTAASNARYTGSLQTTLVPEPTSLILMLGGLGGIAAVGRRHKAA
jgi:PEP-CTERM motif